MTVNVELKSIQKIYHLINKFHLFSGVSEFVRLAIRAFLIEDLDIEKKIAERKERRDKTKVTVSEDNNNITIIENDIVQSYKVIRRLDF